MLREGSLRQDLAETLPQLVASGVNLQRLILVTDSMTPDDVAECGHMDQVVRRAIALGLTPMQAIQSVTLNSAVYSGLEQEIGGIAPGRRADLIFLESLEECAVKDVWIAAKHVAEGGQSLVHAAPITWPADMSHSLRLKPAATADSFKIAAPAPAPKIRVMSLINQNITTERLVEVNAA